MRDIRRIFIVGIYGTGKSTLAGRLGKLLRLPIYGADDIKYKRKYDIEYPLIQRLKKIKEISKKKKWIFEGPLTSHAIALYKNADLVILMLPKKWTAIKRIIFRHFKRRSQNLRDHNWKTTYKIINYVNDYYNNNKRFLTKKRHIWYMQRYSKKYIILETSDQIEKFMEEIS